MHKSKTGKAVARRDLAQAPKVLLSIFKGIWAINSKFKTRFRGITAAAAQAPWTRAALAKTAMKAAEKMLRCDFK